MADKPFGQTITDEYQKLDNQDRIVLFTTTGAFFIGFLPWYTIRALGLTQTTNGYVTWHGKLFFLTSLATVCLLLAPALRNQLLSRLSAEGRALTIPILTAATLILGPVFSLVSPPEAFAGIRGAAGQSEGLITGGSTLWLVVSLLACGTASGIAFTKWKQSVAMG